MRSFFFLSGFSFTDTDNSQDSRGREGTIFYSTLPLPPPHEHSDIYLQLCMWDDYHIFLIAPLVFTRLLLDEIYHLIELPFDWLIDDAMFVCLLDELILGFCYSDFDMGNRWIWTRIDYHPCITSEPTNHVCYFSSRFNFTTINPFESACLGNISHISAVSMGILQMLPLIFANSLFPCITTLF